MGSRDTPLPVPIVQMDSPLITRITHFSQPRTTLLLFPLFVGTMSRKWPYVCLNFHLVGLCAVPGGNSLPLHTKTSQLAEPKVLGREAEML